MVNQLGEMELYRCGSSEDGTPGKATAGMEVTPGKAKRGEGKRDREDPGDELLGRSTGKRDRRVSRRRVVRTGFGASYPLPPRGGSFPDASYKGRDGYDGAPGAMPGEVAGCQPHPLSLTLAVPSCKVPSPDPVVSHMPRVDTLEAGANLGRLG